MIALDMSVFGELSKNGFFDSFPFQKNVYFNVYHVIQKLQSLICFTVIRMTPALSGEEIKNLILEMVTLWK